MFEKEAEEYADKQIGCGDGYYEWTDVEQTFKDGAEFGYNKVKEELEEEKKLNAEIKARFVKCNTCTDEMKSKCLMFTENLCEGERCEELIDIVSLVNKSDLERKIEALEKANEWHYVKDGELPKIGKPCLVYLVNSCVIIARLREDNVWTTDGHNAFENVIAWKEIVLPKEIE